MYKAKCKNPKCSQVFAYSYHREPGGVNDNGYVTIKCSKCGSTCNIPVQNPKTVGGVEGGVLVGYGCVDSREEWMELLRNEPEILSAPNGLPENDSDPDFCLYDYSLWVNDSYNFELEAAYFKLVNFGPYTDKIKDCLNYYLKSKIDPHQLFIIHDYKMGKYKARMIWAKTINSEHDLTARSIYLVHHNRVDLEKRVDGLYLRDDAKIILERLLVRWKYLSNQVIIATPFIGFNYSNSIPKVQQLWKWLDSVVDCEKLKFITRENTYQLLKQSQDVTDFKSDFLTEWKIFDKIVEESEKTLEAKKRKDKLYDFDNAPVSFVQKFHAKFYAGVFDNHVELLIGSYNIHTGKYWENLSFKRYNKDEFLNMYMKKLCPNFKYKEVEHDSVLLLKCTKEQNEQIRMASFKDVLKEIV